jgi:hypothetical protein
MNTDDHSGDALACGGKQRRLALFGNDCWNGIDYLDVDCDQHSLCVHFFGAAPRGLTPANIRIEGGRRVQGIRALSVSVDDSDDPERDDCLHIALDKFGDFSVYRLCLVNAPPRGGALEHIDPRYACLDFSFKRDCPSEFDCKSEPACVPEPAAAPEISYLARDYQSFRQLMLDRLALILPDWRERHVPDLGITLVELLAYKADMLSYYLDAVATEAYLDTARLRTSVRRHLRLLDYRLHEGCNARAWLALTTDAPHAVLPADVSFATAAPALARINGSSIVPVDAALRLPAGSYLAFQPVLQPCATVIDVYQARNAIAIYTWGDTECCLVQGATRATLLDDERALRLAAGDVLIFQEELGPDTGRAADRDPSHRHAVRLTRVCESSDGLLGHQVLEVEWAAADALPFALCLSIRRASPDCDRKDGISIACGNVILVEHGVPVVEDCGAPGEGASAGDCACEGSIVEMAPSALPFHPRLGSAPLTHSVAVAWDAPATLVMAQDPYQAAPRIWLDGGGQRWDPRADLLDSDWADDHFVADIDDDGGATLRFGDGELGAMPAAGTPFSAHYQVGNGADGNVGAEAISVIVYRSKLVDGVSFAARNPLPAQGGLAPEPVAQAKQNAPDAFRLVLQRAITADDYATLAQRDARISRAHAELRWNGSWYEAVVALDPLGRSGAGAALRGSVAGQLERYRRIGHDLEVNEARYVPLEVAFEICVRPHYVPGHVLAALADVFSNRRLADGTLGFFHPDRLTFGGAINASALIGAAQAVDGVQSVCLTALHRYGEEPDTELADGRLVLRPGEIAQLDNDPDFPEHGKLTITPGGVR